MRKTTWELHSNFTVGIDLSPGQYLDQSYSGGNLNIIILKSSKKAYICKVFSTAYNIKCIAGPALTILTGDDFDTEVGV